MTPEQARTELNRRISGAIVPGMTPIQCARDAISIAIDFMLEAMTEAGVFKNPRGRPPKNSNIRN